MSLFDFNITDKNALKVLKILQRRGKIKTLFSYVIALRVSDELYNLDNEQIQACLEHSCQWPLGTVFQSWTLQKIVQSLDSVCHQRSLQETWNSNDQLFRAVYLMSLNLLKV